MAEAEKEAALQTADEDVRSTTISLQQMECVQDVRREQVQKRDDDEQDIAAVNDEYVPISPDPPNDVEMTGTESCAECCRTNTQRYNRNFQTLHRDSSHRTMFGKPVAELTGETIRMCQLCTDYNNNINRHKDWANAWPSVMYTFV